MVSLINRVHFGLIVKLIVTSIVVIPLITCNPICNNTTSNNQESTGYQSNNSSLNVTVQTENCTNQLRDVNRQDPVVTNDTGHLFLDDYRSFLNDLQNIRIEIVPIVKILNESAASVTLIGTIISESNDTTQFRHQLPPVEISPKQIIDSSGDVKETINELDKELRDIENLLSDPNFQGNKSMVNYTSSDSPTTSTSAKPSTVSEETRTVTSTPRSVIFSTTIAPENLDTNKSTEDTPATDKVTKSICPVCPEVNSPLSTRSILISTSTTSPLTVSPLTRATDSVRVMTTVAPSLGNQVNPVRQVPETPWTPEGFFKLSSYKPFQKPGMIVSMVRPSDRPINNGNQRQVQFPPSQGPAPVQVNYGHLNAPPSWQSDYNQLNNQNKGNIINTRANNQYQREKLNNPSPNNNNNQYNVPNNQATGQPKHGQNLGQPYAVEEIVHSQRSTIDQRSRGKMEPELFVKIIRHYFANVLNPREIKQIVTRNLAHK